MKAGYARIPCSSYICMHEHGVCLHFGANLVCERISLGVVMFRAFFCRLSVFFSNKSSGFVIAPPLCYRTPLVLSQGPPPG